MNTFPRPTAPTIQSRHELDAVVDRAKLSLAELRQAGLKIVQEERFYLSPYDSASGHDAAEWQEAA